MHQNVYVATLSVLGVPHLSVINAQLLRGNERDRLRDFMNAYTNVSCVLCASELPRYPNNAAGLIDGQCCDRCNSEHVIPYRLSQHLMTTVQSRKRTRGL